MPQSSHKRTPVRYRDQVHYVSDDVAVVGTTSFIKWNEREVKRQYAKLRGAKFGTPEFGRLRKLLSSLSPAEKLAAKSKLHSRTSSSSCASSCSSSRFGGFNSSSSRYDRWRPNHASKGWWGWGPSKTFARSSDYINRKRRYDRYTDPKYTKLKKYTEVPPVTPLPGQARAPSRFDVYEHNSAVEEQDEHLLNGVGPVELTVLSKRLRDQYEEGALTYAEDLPDHARHKIAGYLEN